VGQFTFFIMPRKHEKHGNLVSHIREIRASVAKIFKLYHYLMEGYYKSSYLRIKPYFMPKSGPIIIIEDDPDDEGIMEEIIKELNFTNKLVYFTNSTDAFDYLKTTSDQPFIIFCDVNIPDQTGIEFKRQIDEHKELKKKSIPFVFYSTSVDPSFVNEAYTQMTVQGFFKKENSYEEIKKSLSVIFDYWQLSKHPNS